MGKEATSGKAFKLFGTIIAACGGITALFLGFGYIMTLSYLSSINLYGIVEFSMQFYKDSIIGFIRAFMLFYSRNGIFFILPALIITWPCLFLFFKSREKDEVHDGPVMQALRRFFQKDFSKAKSRKIIILIYRILFILLFVSVFVGFHFCIKDVPRTDYDRDFISGYIFLFCIPVSIALLLYLVFEAPEFDYKKPLKNHFVPAFVLFIILMIVVPFIYGASIFDIELHKIDIPEYDQDLEIFQDVGAETTEPAVPGGSIQSAPPNVLLYLMGNTSRIDIFFCIRSTTLDLLQQDNFYSLPPEEPAYKLIMVKSDYIKGIKLHYDPKNNINLRPILDALRRQEKPLLIKDKQNSIEKNLEESVLEVRQISAEDLNEWLKE